MRAVLLDTGPLATLFNQSDQHHDAAKQLFNRYSPPFHTTWPVVTEAAWLLRKRPAAVREMVELITDGFLIPVPLSGEAVRRILDLLARYETLELQLADASLVYAAELLDTNGVLTFDLKDFSVLRLADGSPFDINPP